MSHIKTILPVLTTITLTVYAQLIMKWQVTLAGKMPASLTEKGFYIIQLLTNPWVISGFLAVFIGAISWFFALSKLNLSFIYPFIGLTIVATMLASTFLFKETVTLWQILGTILVVLGLSITCIG